MTEEWKACDDPGRLFQFVEAKASDRKCLLFALACSSFSKPAYYQLEGLVGWIGRLKAAEQFAEGEINLHQLRDVWSDGLVSPSNSPEQARVWARRYATGADIYDDPPPTSYVTELLRDIFGNPFRPVSFDPNWRTSTVVALAEGVYADRAFDRLPILADALEDAGCDHPDILAHCRGLGPHARGCWAVDLILGKS